MWKNENYRVFLEKHLKGRYNKYQVYTELYIMQRQGV